MIHHFSIAKNYAGSIELLRVTNGRLDKAVWNLLGRLIRLGHLYIQALSERTHLRPGEGIAQCCDNHVRTRKAKTAHCPDRLVCSRVMSRRGRQASG